MQIRTSPKSAGNALLITLLTTTILGFMLASYLDMISSQNLSTMRSQQWNSALPILESGIEEALTQMYYNGTNLGGNGWSLVNGNYRKERVLGQNKFVVSVNVNGAKPVITAQGYVPVPFGTNYIQPPRSVAVTVTNAPMFAKGMVAKGQINLNGNNIVSNSFDSGDPNYNTNGRYDPNKTKANGDIATDSTLTNSLNVGNAKIWGHVSTGPGGTVTTGPNDSVGDTAWHAGGNLGIEVGWSKDDMNVQFPDVQAPFAGGALIPTSGTVNGTNYTYVLMSGNYQLSSLTMAGQNKIYVGGNAVLYVTGNVLISGQATVQIAPTAMLNLYVAGATASLSGQGMLNSSANATNFSYWGLPSNTSLTVSGNAAFTGSIYAPEADLSLNGGGNNSYDFVGASVTGTATMNGHFNFHYDENLGRVGPRRGYAVDSWNEIFTYTEL